MRSFWLAALAVASSLFLSEPASACVFHNPDTCGLSPKNTAQSRLTTQQLPLLAQYSGLELLGSDAHLINVEHDGFSQGQVKDLGRSFAFTGELREAQGSFSPPDQVTSAFIDIGGLAGNGKSSGLKFEPNNLGWTSLVGDPDLLRVGDGGGTNISPSVAPLPASWTMMLMGLALLGIFAWFRPSSKPSKNAA